MVFKEIKDNFAWSSQSKNYKSSENYFKNRN